MDKSFYSDGLKFECEGCGGCCKTHGDYAYVYLGDNDISNACELLKLKRIDFLNEYCATDDYGNIHLTMILGNCNFLESNNRCKIYDARPTQCKTWPFWRENLTREEWEVVIKQNCPGIGKGKIHSKEEIEKSVKKRDDAHGIDF